MSRPAPEIQLSTEEKETLLHWMRSTKTERRMVERARVILLAANGLNGKEIAARMETRTARVSKWLRRFAKDRIAGLLDAPRPGEKRRKYNPATEERILKALDEPPPAGYSRWNGRLLAEHLGQVSKDQVWRVMRKHHAVADLYPDATQRDHGLRSNAANNEYFNKYAKIDGALEAINRSVDDAREMIKSVLP